MCPVDKARGYGSTAEEVEHQPRQHSIGAFDIHCDETSLLHLNRLQEVPRSRIFHPSVSVDGAYRAYRSN